MQKALLIAEKGSLMNTIKDVYDKNKDKIPYEIDFTSQRGHLVELLMPDEIDENLKTWSWDTLPFHPDEHGGWKYKVKKEKRVGNFPTAQERFESIKEAINSCKYDFIINAGDPDQEGELLIHLVLNEIGNTLPVKRFWSNNLTDENILKSLQNLRDDNEKFFANILDAAHARQRSDYRFGLNLTRAATLKMGGTAAVGRVKTVMLNMVVQRENQIRNFKEEIMYGVKLNYKEGFSASLYVPPEQVEAVNDEDDEDINKQEKGIVWFKTKQEAENVLSKLQNISSIESYQTKEERQKPPKLFKMVTAQNAAGKAFGYQTDQVDKIIQELYEMKLLSYPRTDCEYIPSNEDLKSILEAFKEQPGLYLYTKDIKDEDIARVKRTKKWCNDTEVNKAGHTALIPTTKSINGTSLTQDQLNIYMMVAKQFISIFMPDLVQNKVEILSKNSEHLFRTTGKTLINPGYTKIFNTDIKDINVPVVEKGQIVNVESKETTEKKTTCPKRFTSTSLAMACDNPIKYLEDDSLKALGKELKIGTPATRSGIIKELIERDNYMKNVKNGKKIEIAPTPTGEIIIDNLKDFDICKVDMTGMWEEELISVRNGELGLEEIEKRMKERVNKAVEDFKNANMKAIPSNNKYQEIAICPKCGGKIIEGPKMFFCTNGKEHGCKVGGFKEVYGATITRDEFLGMLQGQKYEKEMTFKNKETGKVSNWKQEVGLNENGTITPIKKNENTGWKCPACGKDIYEKTSVYACEGNDDGSCGVIFGKTIGGVDISKEDFRKLFTEGQSGVIKKIKSSKKKGQTYNARLVINKETKKVDMEFVEDREETNLKCPVCGKPLLETKFKYVCTGESNNTCHFEMYKLMFKKPIPKEQVKDLLYQVKMGEIDGKEEAFITPNGPVETRHICPFCGDKIMRENMKFFCAGTKKGTCKFEAYRNIGTHILTDAEFDTLLTAGRTTTICDIPSSKGGTYDARAILDWDTQSIKTEYVNEERESNYYCPICHKKLMKNGKKLTCDCGFGAWTIAGGRSLTEKEISQLFLKGETDFLTNLKKKDGTKMGPTKIAIDKENKSTKFVFKKTK